MIGAIIGDIAGSTYEFHSIKTKDFPLFAPGSSYTDDSLMSIAVASALMQTGEGHVGFKSHVVTSMRQIAAKYPCPMGGYGGRFRHWLVSSNPRPYGSFGNGSAMRVSPCGDVAATLDEALELARQSAEVTHNHPEGIKGAQAVAAAIYLARTGESRDGIRSYIEQHFYPLHQTVDEIRPRYPDRFCCALRRHCGVLRHFHPQQRQPPDLSTAGRRFAGTAGPSHPDSLSGTAAGADRRINGQTPIHRFCTRCTIQFLMSYISKYLLCLVPGCHTGFIPAQEVLSLSSCLSNDYRREKLNPQTL